MRLRTLPAAVAPVLVGSALAWHDGRFDAGAAAICLGFALLVQIGTNFANDYYDFVKGADTASRVGPTRAVAAGLVAPAVMRRAMILVLAAAFVLGLSLIAWGGPWLLLVGAASVVCAVAYTGGPYPLGYHGLGDLFVVRVAGNVVAPSIVGSVEFAVESLGTTLVVVMGHTQCGAIKATVDSLAAGGHGLSTNLRDLVSRISPAVANLLNTGLSRDELLISAERANVRASVNQLRHSTRTFEDRIAAGTLAIIGAEYALETGQVDFFDL